MGYTPRRTSRGRKRARTNKKIHTKWQMQHIQIMGQNNENNKQSTQKEIPSVKRAEEEKNANMQQNTIFGILRTKARKKI